MNPLLDDDLTGPRPPVFLGALRHALGRTPVWLLCWLVPLLLALALAVPWRGFYDGVLAHRYEPLSVLASMDQDFRLDQRQELGALKQSTAAMAAALALCVMLFGVFAGGGWLQVFLERTLGHSMRRFLWGGARYFWRFLRVWLLTLLTLALFSWIFYGWPWKTATRLLIDSIISIGRPPTMPTPLAKCASITSAKGATRNRTRSSPNCSRSATQPSLAEASSSWRNSSSGITGSFGSPTG